MLPPWVGKAPRTSFSMGDSIHTAPGWRLVSDDFYTAVEDVAYPRDPEVARAIHEFDPDAIFILRRQAYLPPGGTVPVVSVHHVVARHVTNPRAMRMPFYVEMPPGATVARPNVIDYVHEDIHAPILMRAGGPPPYRPFDEELVKILRERYVDGISRREYAARVERVKARREAAAEAARDEMAWRMRQIEKRLGDRIANLTEADYQQYLAEIQARRQKPARVFLGRSA